MIYALIGYLIFHVSLMLTTLLKYNLFAPVFVRFTICAIAVGIVMTIVFFIAKKIKRYDLVDAAWGWAFMTAALVSFTMQQRGLDDKYELDSQLLVTALVWIWGIRLSSHILRRIKATDREDPRYVEIRKKWKGNVALNVYLRIYVVQAILATVISIPVIHINLFSFSDWTVWAFVGAAIWLVGFVIESRADKQLQTFVHNPKNKGKIMSQGLWKYSRHPNYFGELTQWWGIMVICLGTPFGWVGFIGPVILTYLIFYVSGIPLNEKRFEGRPGWDEYKARTSVLLPLPPKKA